jgi:hypothetical protein
METYFSCKYPIALVSLFEQNYSFSIAFCIFDQKAGNIVWDYCSNLSSDPLVDLWYNMEYYG